MIWKDIKGYKGIYQVNRKGQVKSLVRWRKNGPNSWQLTKERILKTGLAGGAKPDDRYEFYHLKNRLGKGKTHYRHLLIGIYFKKNPKKLPQINHKNGRKRDNSIGNLEWCTHSQNIQHAVKNRLIPCGEQNYNSKLTERDIIKIRSDNRSLSKIAADYGVSFSLIGSIKRRKTWKHV